MAPNFDLRQITLKQMEIFLHKFLKYRLLIKIGPGTVWDINNVSHLFSPSFDVCSKDGSEYQSVTQYLLDFMPCDDGICSFIRVVMVSIYQ